MELRAVYTGDSRKFHIFQISDEQGPVGSVYLPKELGTLPDAVEINLITPQRDLFLWKKDMEGLIEKARPGSKAEAKLQRTYKEYKNGS